MLVRLLGIGTWAANKLLCCAHQCMCSLSRTTLVCLSPCPLLRAFLCFLSSSRFLGFSIPCSSYHDSHERHKRKEKGKTSNSPTYRAVKPNPRELPAVKREAITYLESTTSLPSFRISISSPTHSASPTFPPQPLDNIVCWLSFFKVLKSPSANDSTPTNNKPSPAKPSPFPPKRTRH